MKKYTLIDNETGEKFHYTKRELWKAFTIIFLAGCVFTTILIILLWNQMTLY